MKGSMLLMVMALLLAAGEGMASPSGEKLFNQKCAMCHIVRGKGGAIGPELTRVAVRMNDAQLRQKVMFPKRSTPSSTMPSFQTLPRPDIEALIGYLRTLR